MGEINDDWIRAHGEALASALLDPSFCSGSRCHPLGPGDLTYTDGKVFSDAAERGLESTGEYKDFTGGGTMPDILASPRGDNPPLAGPPRGGRRPG
jgi:hypothetical protein